MEIWKDDMDYDLIGNGPIRPGYGLIYQGGTPDGEIYTLRSPLIIVTLNTGEVDQKYINNSSIYGVIAPWIEDVDTGILPDDVLLGLVAAIHALLASGINLYIHCAAGISRSSYITCALHMRINDMNFEDAIKYIRKYRCLANPNPGFTEHLQRLERRLRGRI